MKVQECILKQEAIESLQQKELEMTETINADKEHISTLQSDIQSIKGELDVATQLCKQLNSQQQRDKSRIGDLNDAVQTK